MGNQTGINVPRSLAILPLALFEQNAAWGTSPVWRLRCCPPSHWGCESNRGTLRLLGCWSAAKFCVSPDGTSIHFFRIGWKPWKSLVVSLVWKYHCGGSGAPTCHSLDWNHLWASQPLGRPCQAGYVDSARAWDFSLQKSFMQIKCSSNWQISPNMSSTAKAKCRNLQRPFANPEYG